MNSPRYRKEYVYVDYSAVYFENERLTDKMHQQVETLRRKKHRLFLSRQAEIANVVGYFEKLQAFRQAVTNTAAFRLRACLKTISPNTNKNRSNENIPPRESIKINPYFGNSSERDKNTGEVQQSTNKRSSFSVTSENTSCAVQNDSVNVSMKNQIKNRYVRTAFDIDSQTHPPKRMSPFDQPRPLSVRERRQSSLIRENSILERQASAPSLKNSSQFTSQTREESRGLNKRPSSSKEQWAGLTERPTLQRNSSTVTNYRNFRSTETKRIRSPKCIDVLTLRRLREIYILEKPEVGMSGHKRANLTQHLLLENQKRNNILQEKVRNFLEELEEKRRKKSIGTELFTNLSNLRWFHNKNYVYW